MGERLAGVDRIHRDLVICRHAFDRTDDQVDLAVGEL